MPVATEPPILGAFDVVVGHTYAVNNYQKRSKSQKLPVPSDDGTNVGVIPVPPY